MLTLGGDGTILHASSLFKSGAVPPVLSFSMGTLGFLLPFRPYMKSTLARISTFTDLLRFADIDDFATALEGVFQGKATVLYRMRLSCTFFDRNGAPIGKPGEGSVNPSI